MVQYYTLEEAAQILRLTPDQLKEMVKAGKLRAFQDRGTLRFRSQEIDELARRAGHGSDADMPLGEGNKPSGPSSSARKRSKVAPPPEEKGEASDDFDFTLTVDDEVALGKDPPASGKGTPTSSKQNTRSSKSKLKSPQPRSSDSDVRLVADGSDLNFNLELDGEAPAKSASPKPRPSRLAPGSNKPKTKGSKLAPPAPKSDSDVRLVPPKPGSDSDVKIVPDGPEDNSIPIGQNRAKTPSDSDIRLETDEGPTRSTGDRAATP